MPIPVIIAGAIAVAPVIIENAPKVIGVLGKIREFLNTPEFQAIWQKFKACFTKSPAPMMLTEHALESRRHERQNELQDSMRKVCPDFKGDQVEFGLRATEMVADVLDHCLHGVRGTSGSSMLESTFTKAAATARKLVDKHLEVELKEQKADTASVSEEKLPDPNNPQGPEVRRIRLKRNSPRIENLVVSAGGAKGVGNAPALRALQNLGTLSELKQVVGVADGALTAISLASGMSAGEFQQLCDKSSTTAMRDTSVDFADRYPGVELGTMREARSNMGKRAGNTLEIMDQSSATFVSSHLNDHWQDIEQKSTGPAPEVTGPERDRLQALKKQDFKTDRTRQMITFGDLALLNRLAPEKFRQLVVTGYNPGTQETVHFSAASHPDMPVALAGRISVGTSGVFQPVAYGGQHYFGGGIGGKMPSEGITEGLSGPALQEANNKTLVLTCDESGNAYSMMHDDAAASGGATNSVMDWFKNASAPDQKAHAKGLNVLPIYHGPVASDASKEQIHEARTQAWLMALEHIGNVMENSRQDLVEDERAAARLMSVREQDRFLEDYGDSTVALNVSMCNVIRALQEARILM